MANKIYIWLIIVITGLALYMITDGFSSEWRLKDYGEAFKTFISRFFHF